MKRDMELVRRILLTIEDRTEDSNESISIEGCSTDNLRLHLRLMEDASLVNEVSFSSSGGAVDRMSWEGYEQEHFFKDFPDLHRPDFECFRMLSLSLSIPPEIVRCDFVIP